MPKPLFAALLLLLLASYAPVRAQVNDDAAVEISVEALAKGISITYSVRVQGSERLEFHASATPSFTPSNSTLRSTIHIAGSVDGSVKFDGFTPGQAVYVRAVAYASDGEASSSVERGVTPCEGTSLQPCGGRARTFDDRPSVDVRPNGYQVAWTAHDRHVERYEIRERKGAGVEDVVGNVSGATTSALVAEPPIWDTDEPILRVKQLRLRVVAVFPDGTSDPGETAFTFLEWKRPRAVIELLSRPPDDDGFRERIGIRVGEIVEVSGNASTDPYGQPLSYLWTWGDGISTTGVSASHVYMRPGTFTIQLRVTDPHGNYGATYKDTNLTLRIDKSIVDSPPPTFNGSPYDIAQHLEGFTFEEGAKTKFNVTLSNSLKVAGPAVKARILAGGVEVVNRSLPGLFPGGNASIDTGEIIVRSDRDGTFPIRIEIDPANGSEVEAFSFPLGVVHPPGGWINLENLTLTPPKALLGEYVKARVTLWNPGEKASPPVWIKWYHDDVPFRDETYVEPLRPHEWRTVAGPIWMPGLRTSEVKAAYFLPGQTEEDFMHTTTARLDVAADPERSVELPDLAITRYRLNKDRQEVEVTIENVGSARAPSTLVTRSNYTGSLEVSIPSLGPGETSVVSFPHEAGFATVSVNARNEFAELNDRNNQRDGFDRDDPFIAEGDPSAGGVVVPEPSVGLVAMAIVVGARILGRRGEERG